MCVCVYTGHTFLEGALFSTAERCIVHVFHLLFLTFSFLQHVSYEYEYKYTPEQSKILPPPIHPNHSV